MKKSNIEKLIKERHPHVISKRSDRDIWYTRDPKDPHKKVSATSLDKLYEKLYQAYYGEAEMTVAEPFPIWAEWHQTRRGTVSLSMRRYRQQFEKYFKKVISGRLRSRTSKEVI